MNRRVGGIAGLWAAVWLGACLSTAAALEEQPVSREAQELITQLDSTDLYVQQMAFMKLEALREPATAVIVRRYLGSPDAQTRAFSARAVAAIEGTAAVPVLVERLKQDSSPYVRLAALLALEPLQDPSLMSAFIEALRDRNPEVRMAAVDVVSRLKDPQAQAAIRLRWQREHHRDVRRVLKDAMQRIGAW